MDLPDDVYATELDVLPRAAGKRQGPDLFLLASTEGLLLERVRFSARLGCPLLLLSSERIILFLLI